MIDPHATIVNGQQADQIIQDQRDEIDRLKSLIDRAAKHWIHLHPGVSWEGDIADAMAAATSEIARLREAILRLADQDATLSVCNGNVTVEMEATLTPEEREAVAVFAYWADIAPVGSIAGNAAATLRGLLERMS